MFYFLLIDEFITPTLSISQNMKNSLEGRHIGSLHAGGRHPIIGPGYAHDCFLKLGVFIRQR